jgi:hypothetical protein
MIKMLGIHKLMLIDYSSENGWGKTKMCIKVKKNKPQKIYINTNVMIHCEKVESEMSILRIWFSDIINYGKRISTNKMLFNTFFDELFRI